MPLENQSANRAQKQTDIRCVDAELYFIPLRTRVPLKFGHEVVTSVTVARTKVTVADANGRTACGWGETPLSVQWVWPSAIPYEERHQVLLGFCKALTREWARFNAFGHPLEVGYDFQRSRLTELVKQQNTGQTHAMPWLAALVCCSLFDIALHDAYGVLHNIPIYDTYNARFMNRDLSAFLESADADVDFRGKYPSDYLVRQRPNSLPAWHLVGGLDALTSTDAGAFDT